MSASGESLTKENECTTAFFSYLELKGPKEIAHECWLICDAL